MKILVTGSAGFIGFHVCERLANAGFYVVGVDNVNDYYDTDLKWARLERLGFNKVDVSAQHQKVQSTFHSRLSFIRLDLKDLNILSKLFEEESFDVVCNLAAQAGVRYSLTNPQAYLDSNIQGFLNLLEACRHADVGHLVYASSSSVYGNSDTVPFSTEHKTDKPISLYAATKKSNELLAHCYGHLYGLRTTGLRFFTVYGPWGRPDMAYYIFAEAILSGKPIQLFNHGEMERDFTYIDDIVTGIVKILHCDISDREHHCVYNIGNSQTRHLNDLVENLEKCLARKAVKEYLPMQPGDVMRTFADVSALEMHFGYSPSTSLERGIELFSEWFLNYQKD